MWNEFNFCWLGVAQKQKDLLEDMLQTGRLPHRHREMLSIEVVEKLCDEVVGLGDKMEPHGLVDYQMGFWEEEILSGEFFFHIYKVFFWGGGKRAFLNLSGFLTDFWGGEQCSCSASI